jgi:hypothetical protein
MQFCQVQFQHFQKNLDCGNPKCGGTMKAAAFITDYAAVGCLIGHLKLRFIAEKPPPSQAAFQETLMAADPVINYFS